MLLVQCHFCNNYCLHMCHLLCVYLALCQLFYQHDFNSSWKYPFQTGFTSPLSREGHLDELIWNIIKYPHLLSSEMSVLHSSLPRPTVHLCRHASKCLNYECMAAVITWRTNGEYGEQLLWRLGRGHRNGLAVKSHLSVKPWFLVQRIASDWSIRAGSRGPMLEARDLHTLEKNKVAATGFFLNLSAHPNWGCCDVQTHT